MRYRTVRHRCSAPLKVRRPAYRIVSAYWTSPSTHLRQSQAYRPVLSSSLLASVVIFWLVRLTRRYGILPRTRRIRAIV